jgi:hypothetical protein
MEGGVRQPREAAFKDWGSLLSNIDQCMTSLLEYQELVLPPLKPMFFNKIEL